MKLQFKVLVTVRICFCKIVTKSNLNSVCYLPLKTSIQSNHLLYNLVNSHTLFSFGASFHFMLCDFTKYLRELL